MTFFPFFNGQPEKERRLSYQTAGELPHDDAAENLPISADIPSPSEPLEPIKFPDVPDDQKKVAEAAQSGLDAGKAQIANTVSLDNQIFADHLKMDFYFQVDKDEKNPQTVLENLQKYDPQGSVVVLSLDADNKLIVSVKEPAAQPASLNTPNASDAAPQQPNTPNTPSDSETNPKMISEYRQGMEKELEKYHKNMTEYLTTVPEQYRAGVEKTMQAVEAGLKAYTNEIIGYVEKNPQEITNLLSMMEKVDACNLSPTEIFRYSKMYTTDYDKAVILNVDDPRARQFIGMIHSCSAQELRAMDVMTQAADRAVQIMENTHNNADENPETKPQNKDEFSTNYQDNLTLDAGEALEGIEDLEPKEQEKRIADVMAEFGVSVNPKTFEITAPKTGWELALNKIGGWVGKMMGLLDQVTKAFDRKGAAAETPDAAPDAVATSPARVKAELETPPGKTQEVLKAEKITIGTQAKAKLEGDDGLIVQLDAARLKQVQSDAKIQELTAQMNAPENAATRDSLMMERHDALLEKKKIMKNIAALKKQVEEESKKLAEAEADLQTLSKMEVQPIEKPLTDPQKKMIQLAQEKLKSLGTDAPTVKVNTDKNGVTTVQLRDVKPDGAFVQSLPMTIATQMDADGSLFLPEEELQKFLTPPNTPGA